MILLILITSTISAKQCSWIKPLDQNYASKQFKSTFNGHRVKLNFTNNAQAYTECILAWLDKSQIVQDNQSRDLWIQLNSDRTSLIFQSKTDGLQIKILQTKRYHYLALLLCLLLLIINNRRTKKVSFAHIIDSVNDLIHLLHNQQNQDLILTPQNIKKLKVLSNQLDSPIQSKFYFKVDDQQIKFQTLKSEVSTIVKECLVNTTLESSTRKLYLKTLSKYSSYCYLNFASLLTNKTYKIEGDLIQNELSFFYTPNTNWDYHEQQLQNIINDWMDITYDNATKYSKNHKASFVASNDTYPTISICNPASLDLNKSELIQQRNIQELSRLKKRSTGYPKLLSDIEKYNDTLKRSRQSLSLQLDLMQNKDMVTASLSFQSKLKHSQGLNILIIDDDAQSKYFQHSPIDKCLKQHQLTIKKTFVCCKDLQDDYDLILMDRNFPIDEIDGDFVSYKEIQFLCAKFDPNNTFLVSTDSSDCSDLFQENHILSVRNLVSTINKINKNMESH
ncbi:MAG: hypothetical protein KC646_00690 [Candidatus Cloacimonetes bacterium]|nr:hypothetical protein [Candidatus Cloacimonadota bacterium]